ncbi:MAG: DUF5675 family protein [Prevotella sp.]
MDIKVKRIARKDKYTIGKLYVNGVYVCDTLEDKDRGLRQDMALPEIQKLKVKNETAIPSGKYSVRLDVESPRFGGQSFYKSVCNGCLPRLENVPGFEGVLIHCGNTDKDSSGCILIGQNKVVGQVINSRDTFTKLWNVYLSRAKKSKEKVTITIE